MLHKRRSKGINDIVLVKMLLNHAKSPKSCAQKRAKRHKNCAHQVADARTHKNLPLITYTPKKH